MTNGSAAADEIWELMREFRLDLRASQEEMAALRKEADERQRKFDKGMEELRAIQKETKKLVQEVAEEQKKTDEQLRKTDRQLKATDNRFNTQWGAAGGVAGGGQPGAAIAGPRHRGASDLPPGGGGVPYGKRREKAKGVRYPGGQRCRGGGGGGQDDADPGHGEILPVGDGGFQAVFSGLRSQAGARRGGVSEKRIGGGDICRAARAVRGAGDRGQREHRQCGVVRAQGVPVAGSGRLKPAGV